MNGPLKAEPENLNPESRDPRENTHSSQNNLPGSKDPKWGSIGSQNQLELVNHQGQNLMSFGPIFSREAQEPNSSNRQGLNQNQHLAPQGLSPEDLILNSKEIRQQKSAQTSKEDSGYNPESNSKRILTTGLKDTTNHDLDETPTKGIKDLKQDGFKDLLKPEIRNHPPKHKAEPPKIAINFEQNNLKNFTKLSPRGPIDEKDTLLKPKTLLPLPPIEVIQEEEPYKEIKERKGFSSYYDKKIRKGDDKQKKDSKDQDKQDLEHTNKTEERSGYLDILNAYKNAAWSKDISILQRPSQMARGFIQNISFIKNWKLTNQSGISVKSYSVITDKMVICIYQDIESSELGFKILKMINDEWLEKFDMDDPFKDQQDINLQEVFASPSGQLLFFNSDQNTIKILYEKNGTQVLDDLLTLDTINQIDYSFDEKKNQLMCWDDKNDILFVRSQFPILIKIFEYGSEKVVDKINSNFLDKFSVFQELVENQGLAVSLMELCTETYNETDYLIIYTVCQLDSKQTILVMFFEISDQVDNDGFPVYKKICSFDTSDHLLKLGYFKQLETDSHSFVLTSDNFFITPREKKVCFMFGMTPSDEIANSIKNRHDSKLKFSNVILCHIATLDFENNRLEKSSDLQFILNFDKSRILDENFALVSCSKDEKKFYAHFYGIRRKIFITLKDSHQGIDILGHSERYDSDRDTKQVINEYKLADEIDVGEYDLSLKNIGIFGSEKPYNDDEVIIFDLNDKKVDRKIQRITKKAKNKFRKSKRVSKSKMGSKRKIKIVRAIRIAKKETMVNFFIRRLDQDEILIKLMTPGMGQEPNLIPYKISFSYTKSLEKVYNFIFTLDKKQVYKEVLGFREVRAQEDGQVPLLIISNDFKYLYVVISLFACKEDQDERIIKDKLSAVFIFENKSHEEKISTEQKGNIHKLINYAQFGSPWFFKGSGSQMKLVPDEKQHLFLSVAQNQNVSLYEMRPASQSDLLEGHLMVVPSEQKQVTTDKASKEKKGEENPGASFNTCKEIQKIRLKKTIDLSQQVRICTGDIENFKFFTICYINNETKRLLYSLIMEVWQLRLNREKPDEEEIQIQALNSLKKLNFLKDNIDREPISKTNQFRKVQVQRILYKEDQEKNKLRNVCMLDGGDLIIANSHLFALIETKTEIRFSKIQESRKFIDTDHIVTSQDKEFILVRTKSTDKQFLYSYSLWKLNEDKTVQLLEKLVKTDRIWQISGSFDRVFWMINNKVRSRVIRVIDSSKEEFDWSFLNNFIKSIQIDPDDDEEVRRFRINQLVDYIKSQYYKKFRATKATSWLIQEAKHRSNNKLDFSLLRHTKKLNNHYNLLYLILAAKNEDKLREYLNIYGYRPFFNPKGLDPLLIAFELNHFQSLDVITHYLSREENKRLLALLYDHDTFYKAMITKHPKLQHLILKNLFIDANEQRDETQKLIISKIDQFPLRKGSQAHMMSCYYSVLDTVTRNEIMGLISKGVRKKKSFAPVEVLTTRIKFSSNIMDTSCRNMLDVAQAMQDKDLEGDFYYIVRFIWNENRWGWVSFFLGLELMLLVCLNIQLFFLPTNFFAFFFTEIFAIIELSIEVMGFLSQENYWRMTENWIDLPLYIFIIFISFLIYADFYDRENEALNFIITCLILFSGLRGMNLMSIWDETRYLNAMILEVFTDILGFMGVTILFIIIFALAGINNFPLKVPGIGEEKKVFGGFTSKGLADLRHQSNYYYNVLLGGWEDASEINEWKSMDFVLFLISSGFLAFIMANLVIAMISATFERFEENKNLYDTKIMINILLEHSYILSYFEKKNEEETSLEDQTSMKHLCIIKATQEEEKHINEIVSDAFESTKESIAESLHSSMERLTDQLEVLNNNIQRNHHEINDNKSHILKSEQQFNRIEEFLANIEGKVNEGQSSLHSEILNLKKSGFKQKPKW